MNDRPVGKLVQELSQQTATLVRQELQLAQVEMKEKGKRAGVGAGLFGGAGVVALYGGGALIAAIISRAGHDAGAVDRGADRGRGAVRGGRGAGADRQETGRAGHPGCS